MRDPELVVRAQQAATALESAWCKWRGVHGLGDDSQPPVSSYVGYSLDEPWGQARIVFGLSAADAEHLAVLLERHDCVGPVHKSIAAREPDDFGSGELESWNLDRHPASGDQPRAASPDLVHVPAPTPASAGEQAGPAGLAPPAGPASSRRGTRRHRDPAAVTALTSPTVPGGNSPGTPIALAASRAVEASAASRRAGTGTAPAGLASAGMAPAGLPEQSGSPAASSDGLGWTGSETANRQAGIQPGGAQPGSAERSGAERDEVQPGYGQQSYGQPGYGQPGGFGVNGNGHAAGSGYEIPGYDGPRHYGAANAGPGHAGPERASSGPAGSESGGTGPGDAGPGVNGHGVNGHGGSAYGSAEYGSSGYSGTERGSAYGDPGSEGAADGGSAYGGPASGRPGHARHGFTGSDQTRSEQAGSGFASPDYGAGSGSGGLGYDGPGASGADRGSADRREPGQYGRATDASQRSAPGQPPFDPGAGRAGPGRSADLAGADDQTTAGGLPPVPVLPAYPWTGSMPPPETAARAAAPGQPRPLPGSAELLAFRPRAVSLGQPGPSSAAEAAQALSSLIAASPASPSAPSAPSVSPVTANPSAAPSSSPVTADDDWPFASQPDSPAQAPGSALSGLAETAEPGPAGSAPVSPEAAGSEPASGPFAGGGSDLSRTAPITRGAGPITRGATMPRSPRSATADTAAWTSPDFSGPATIGDPPR